MASLRKRRGALDYRLGNVAGEIVKATEGIHENNETTNTIDDTKQIDEMHEIIQSEEERKYIDDEYKENMNNREKESTIVNQSEEERKDIDDDHKENMDNREEDNTIVNTTERTKGVDTEVTAIFEMPTNTAIVEDKKDMKHVIETNDTNGAEEASEVTVEGTEDKDSDLSEQTLRMQWV